ncbi:MAG: hypothetical protein ACKVOP_09990 [Sphingomonadaceae bacterium]
MDFKLSFKGNEASAAELDFYDAARAVLGFQRSLALTTHFVLSGEIITQAPSLKNARILVRPPSQGSWEIIAGVSVTLVTLAATPKDSVLGHLLRSAYDYVISNILGFHVDFDKSLGQQHTELLASRGLNDISAMSEGRLDALMEKTEGAIVDIHRPIINSHTALTAEISEGYGDNIVGKVFTPQSYDYISNVERLSKPEAIEGLVSSYNVNTFKGRLYVRAEQRPVPFVLAETVRNIEDIQQIVTSLSANAVGGGADQKGVVVTAFRDQTSTGRAKSLFITEINQAK